MVWDVSPGVSKHVLYLRPQGKFLAPGRGRYLLGRETMLLMGLPVHRLNLKGCSENVPCLHVLDM